MTHTLPWVEKYRPKTINNMIDQSCIKEIFNNIIETSDMPHLLLHGPPGTGKTTSVLALANMLFGPIRTKERVLELNASDERGINVVRTKIMNFAKEKLGTIDDKYPSPDFKIIILDEADTMTREAQSALKKIIEDYSKITRFCIICNYITKIIDPIQSRCSKLRFKLIKPEFMFDRLVYITKKENINISDKNLNIIAEQSNGDMRKAIIYLQNLQYLSVSQITDTIIYNLTNVINPAIITDIINNLCFTNRDTIMELMDRINDICGYNINDALINIILSTEKLDDIQKEQICLCIGDTEKNLINGADEYLQYCNVFSFIKAVYNKINIKCEIDFI